MLSKQSLFIYTFCIIIVGLSTLVFKIYFQPSPIQISSGISLQSKNDTNSTKTISNSTPFYTIHIAGAVKNPGVYEFDSSQRLIDVVNKAGGPLDDANLNAVNLAQKLSDGLKIIIPSLKSKPFEEPYAPIQKNSLKAKTKSKTIDINYATFNEIISIPGIGPSIAQRIIEAREQKLFKSHSDLTRVKGIGPKSLKKLNSFISF